MARYLYHFGIESSYYGEAKSLRKLYFPDPWPRAPDPKMVLLPLALQLKRRPVGWRVPALALLEFELGFAQCCRWPQTFFQQSLIEGGHQFGGRGIADWPETYHQPWRSRIHKPASQTDNPFAPDFFPTPRSSPVFLRRSSIWPVKVLIPLGVFSQHLKNNDRAYAEKVSY